MKLHAGIVGTLLFFTLMAVSVGAYATQIKAPAVLFNQDAGVVTTITVNVTPGNGDVAIKGPQVVNESTLQSAITAARYASTFVGVNETRYNFIYTIYNASNVSGPSGGMAMTLLAVTALQHRQLPSNFTITGTINSAGEAGEIGGIYDKAQAASKDGMHYIIVPEVPEGSFEQQLYYLVQQQFNIPLIEVSNVSQALGYVYGTVQISPVSYNVSANYYASTLPQANITCTACNVSLFVQLTNFTFNYTNSAINAMGPEFSALKSQMLSQNNQYETIAQKGYLYSGADLSFLLYTNAYTFLNSGNVTPVSANLTVSNVSSYCTSLTPPPLTNLNYEYVIGGELRQSWGTVYASLARQQLNASQTSDGLVLAIDDIGKSSAWCRAAQEMYSIASSSGGSYVALSPTVKANATKALNAISNYGTSTLYYQSALDNYKAGNYGASLYASAYAMAFYGGASASSNAMASTMSNLSRYNYGVWPTQFALQAQFYTTEARLTGNQSDNISAYYVADLARMLSSYDQQLNSTFEYNVTAPAPPGISSSEITALSNQISGLQQQLQSLYTVLLAIMVILFVVLLLLVASLLRPQGSHLPRQQQNRSRRHAK